MTGPGRPRIAALRGPGGTIRREDSAADGPAHVPWCGLVWPLLAAAAPGNDFCERTGYSGCGCGCGCTSTSQPAAGIT